MKEVLVAKEHFEDYFEFIKSKIENIELEMELEKEEAIKLVEEKFAERIDVFNKALKDCSVVEYVKEETDDYVLVK